MKYIIPATDPIIANKKMSPFIAPVPGNKNIISHTSNPITVAVVTVAGFCR